MWTALLSRLGDASRPACHEEVTGLVKGYAIAAYAVPADDAGWRSFYKVCNGPSPSYWDALCLIKGTLEGPFASSEAAMQAAQEAAASDIANLPPLAQLPAGRERRGLYLFEWAELRAGAFDSRGNPRP